MKFFDRASFSTRTMTPQGFLEATAKVGRPGVQDYVKGIDFLDSDLPERLRIKPHGTIIKLLRPAKEVFNPQSMKTFEGKPITDDHPSSKVVDSTNVKQLQVGFSRGVSMVQDGSAIEANLLIQDKDTIKRVQLGKDAVSLGYEAEIEFKGGDDPEYGEYDAFMHTIQGNHIAIVDQARAGTGFRLNDNEPNKGKLEMKTRVIDGKSIELSDDAADIFDAMKSEIAVHTSKVAELTTNLNDAKTEIETVKGERDAAKSKSITDADVEKMVAERVATRSALIDAASKVVDSKELDGKSDREIKVAVIAKLSDGKVVVDDAATDDYVNASYNALVATATPKSTKLADGLGGDAKKDSADAARQAMIDARTKK